MDLGHIYIITSPSGKQYVGQAVCYYSNGKKAGYKGRWKGHVYESKENKNGCTALNNAIQKYGHEKFEIKLLEEINTDKLDEREEYWIKELKTLSPNGYNLTTKGGKGYRHNDETKEKMSKSNIGKNIGKNTEKKQRKKEQDKDLPVYLISHYSGNQEGYAVRGHPVLKNRYFVSKKLSMIEKLDLAFAYLKTPQNEIKPYKPSRKKEEDKDLPTHVYSYHVLNTEGYYIKGHPKIKYKTFFNKDCSMEEKLNLTLNFLNSLNPNNQNISEKLND
jgi:group I intron endonuclease